MAKKVLFGKVVSDKMDKTAVVSVTRFYQHALYKKRVNRSKKYFVHDPENKCSVGEEVSFEESRPISKNKTWILKERSES